MARVYKYEELLEATKDFTTELGSGGYGVVYKGELKDGMMVAVKKLKPDEDQFQQFMNEVIGLSHLRHKNLVNLYGYSSPRSQEWLLVYEFVPNGTIAEHLYGKLSPLTWAERIQIAVETAEGIAYLHAREPPIIHRDVKTLNILLDKDLHVKVADFGFSYLLPLDATHESTKPRGTIGYMDPEYEDKDLISKSKLSNKSDVYSFGVVLLELISGQQALDLNRNAQHFFLFNMMENKTLEDFVDPRLGYQSHNDIRRTINSVAELARKCLKPKGYMRPLMKEVLTELKTIQSHDIEYTEGANKGSSEILPEGRISESANVGENLLPDDYEEILSQAVPPVTFSSKKDLFFRLCDHPILVDRGKMSFSLERSTGIKCYTLSARKLDILWGEDPRYWTWKSHVGSRFSEVAEVLGACGISIMGELDCKLLTQRINYVAYLIFEVEGLSNPVESSFVILRGKESKFTAMLFRQTDCSWRAPQARPDGWMELELGEFFSADCKGGYVLIRLTGINTPSKQTRLTVEGIELRPKSAGTGVSLI